jgi:hypothetical protein
MGNKIGFEWGGEQNFVQLVNDNQSKGMVVVEVGCYDGATTRDYIDIVKENQGHVYLIDTFMGTVQNEQFLQMHPNYSILPHAYGEHNNDLYDWVVNTFKSYNDMLTIIKGKSEDVIPTLKDQSIDILFIDADHRYSAVKRDIELSIPKVKPGGILCGHDCEGFDNVGNYTEFELDSDPSKDGRHGGTIQAVYDAFGITQLNGPVWSVKM